jgi:hypothetical protein
MAMPPSPANITVEARRTPSESPKTVANAPPHAIWNSTVIAAAGSTRTS